MSAPTRNGLAVMLSLLLLAPSAAPAAEPASTAVTDAADADAEGYTGERIGATMKDRARAQVLARVKTPAPGEGAACDAQLAYVAEAADVCVDLFATEKRTSRGLPFLKWAYLALWLILLGFFVLTRLKQRRLELEMDELRARLTRLSIGDAPAPEPATREPAP